MYTGAVLTTPHIEERPQQFPLPIPLKHTFSSVNCNEPGKAYNGG